MALFNSDYIKKTFIVKNISRTAGLAGQVATKDILAEGEVVVTNNSNVILDTTTVLTAKDIKLVQSLGTDKDLLQTKINIGELTQYVGTPYSATQEQISYIGFDGVTSGTALVSANNYSYVPYVAIRPNTFFLGQQNLLFWYGPYTSDSSASQKKVATGIAKSFLANFSEQYKVEGFIKVERVVNDARTGVGANATVTKGSKTVTLSTSVTVATGSVIAFGAVADLTSPAYIVESGGTGTSITLDIPWQGASQTFTATTHVGTSAGTDWGVKLTGLPENFDIYSIRQYDKIRFELGGNVNSSTLTTSQEAKDGFGVVPLVTMDENASWGFEGQQYILGIPPKFRTTSIVSTGTYSALSLGFKKSTNHMNGIGSVKGQVILYADKNGGFGTNATGASTSALDVVNAWASNNGWDSQPASSL